MMVFFFGRIIGFLWVLFIFVIGLIDLCYENDDNGCVLKEIFMCVNYINFVVIIVVLIEGEMDVVFLMVIVVCEVYYVDDCFDWIGFYCVIVLEVLKIGFY